MPHLKQNKDYFQSLLENSSDITMVMSEDGVIKYVSPAVQRILGYKAGDIMDKDCFNFVHPDDAAMVKKALDEVIANPNHTKAIEVRIRHKNGQWRIFEGIGKNLLAELNIKGIVITSRDVTEKKQLLEKIEELSKFPLENPNPILRISKEGIILYTNKPAEDFLTQWGCELGGYISEPWRQQIKEVFISGQNKKTELKHRNRIFSLVMVPVSTADYVNLYGDDITEHKKAEEALRQSEERYRKQFEEAIDAIVMADFGTGMIVDCNIAATKLVEREKSEIIGKHQSFLHPAEDIIDGVSKTFKRHVTGEASEILEDRVITKSGQIKDVAIRASRITIEGKEVMQGIFRDVTERKKVEDTLVREKFLSEGIVSNIPAGIAFLDNDFILRRCNYIYADLIRTYTPFTSKQAIGMSYFDYAPGSREQVEDWFQKVRDTGKAETRYGFKLVFKTGDNERVSYWDTSIAPVFDAYKKVEGILILTQDITERKQAEEKLESAYKKLQQTQQELIQASKMTAMGQLAAGISHELNQPLTGIKGFAQAALADLEEKHPIRNDIQRIVEQTERMDKIIRNIRFFAKKAEFKMRELDIHQPLEDALMLLSEQLKLHNIQIEKRLSPNLPKIQGDANQLQQVFLNLITNARDAIDSLKKPQGGKLTVEIAVSPDRKSMEIVFQDTGCGISKKNLEYIFNPFFTTKSPDGGIGLGLSIAYRIIESHKGKIEVESREGQGARVRVLLPVLPENTKGKNKD